MNEELLKKLKSAKTPEELGALLKDAGAELDDKAVKALFDKLNSNELPDDALDGVAGGAFDGEGDQSFSDWVNQLPRNDENIRRFIQLILGLNQENKEA